MITKAFVLLSEGDACAEDIDQGMTLECNHPIGAPGACRSDRPRSRAVGDGRAHGDFAVSKYRPCPLLGEVVVARYLDRKAGRGVYHY